MGNIFARHPDPPVEGGAARPLCEIGNVDTTRGIRGPVGTYATLYRKNDKQHWVVYRDGTRQLCNDDQQLVMRPVSQNTNDEKRDAGELISMCVRPNY